ncbi:HAMP domain-containing histidine kinase [Cryomorphaceae bacterium]|nr:HAMP domain-containing histidine kinase [Cryomorphaceae bacterium]
MKELNKRDDLLTKPLWVALISIGASAISYGIILLFVDVPDPRIGWVLSLSIPAFVAPSITFIIRRYVVMIKKQNQELEELNALNKKLFSLISHDVRSPIASLKSLIEPLRTGQISLDEVQPLLDHLDAQTDELLTFLNELLVWSKDQLDPEDQKEGLFRIAPAIQRTIRLFDEHRKDKKIKLELGTIDLQAYGQAETFSFVFRNLYQNALKFTQSGGQVTVHAAIENGHCLVHIADSGPGMSEESMHKVLNPAEHYSTLGSNGERGTGLGISSSINYLRDHRGELRVKSEQGKGTTFTVVLPIAAA